MSQDTKTTWTQRPKIKDWILANGKAKAQISFVGDEAAEVTLSGTAPLRAWALIGAGLQSGARRWAAGAHCSDAFASSEFEPGSFSPEDLYTHVSVKRGRVVVELAGEDAAQAGLDAFTLKINPKFFTLGVKGGGAGETLDTTEIEALGALLWALAQLGREDMGILSLEGVERVVRETLDGSRPLEDLDQ